GGDWTESDDRQLVGNRPRAYRGWLQRALSGYLALIQNRGQSGLVVRADGNTSASLYGGDWTESDDRQLVGNRPRAYRGWLQRALSGYLA
ncbi:hypothetical protein CGQ17_23830, partial [Enterobacter cloacae]